MQDSLSRILVRLVALIISLPVLASSTALALDTTWTFDGDGDWTEASKWNNGEPIDSTYSVFIDDGDSAVSVTLDTSRTIGSLALGVDDILMVQSPPFTPVTFVSNGLTSDGSIFVTGNWTTALATGTLSNSATGVLHFQQGGGRTFTGDLVNNGTVVIDTLTSLIRLVARTLITINSRFLVIATSMSLPGHSIRPRVLWHSTADLSSSASALR
jgi:hypothetical protein